MPAIAIGAGLPGTSLGVGARVGGQSRAEKQADQATALTEAAERDRAADTAARPAPPPTGLDHIMATDALAKFR